MSNYGNKVNKQTPGLYCKDTIISFGETSLDVCDYKEEEVRIKVEERIK